MFIKKPTIINTAIAYSNNPMVCSSLLTELLSISNSFKYAKSH
jgi:hypothetical protein